MARFTLIPLLLLGFTSGCSDSGVSKVEEVEEEADADEGPPDEPFSTDWGQWLSMTTSPSGQPAITFYDRDRGGIAFATGEISDGEAYSCSAWSSDNVALLNVTLVMLTSTSDDISHGRPARRGRQTSSP